MVRLSVSVRIILIVTCLRKDVVNKIKTAAHACKTVAINIITIIIISHANFVYLRDAIVSLGEKKFHFPFRFTLNKIIYNLNSITNID